MHKLKIRKIGNSYGVTFPKEMLTKLRVGEGDDIVASETLEGFTIAPHEESLERGLRAFERTRKKYRNAFRELAK